MIFPEKKKKKKMKNTIKSVLIISTLLLVLGCSNSDDGGGDGNGEAPKAASLVFPLKDAECNQGEILSDTESKVPFEWNAAEFANKYTVSLTNLETNTTETFDTDKTLLDIILLRGKPYSWKVISKSNSTMQTGTSEVWKLYNAGPGVENYAPFPAELISPKMGLTINTTNTDLKWRGSDADNDIEEFKVYMDVINPPVKLIATQNRSDISNVALEANTIYYWQVETTDKHGNSTKSSVFEFKTQ